MLYDIIYFGDNNFIIYQEDMMLYDNKNYTERQIQIITKIGAEKRLTIDKDKKKTLLTLLLGFVFVIGMGIILVTYDSSYLFLFIFWIIFGGASYYGILRKKTKTISELKTKTDYEIGLYYADSDPRVFGVSDKRLKNLKLGMLIMGILMPFMALLIGLVSFSEVQPDYDQMDMVNGIIEDGEYNEDYISIEIDDGVEYRISSIYSKYIDQDDFLNDVRIGDSVTMFIDPDNGDRDFYSAYYLEIEGVQYLDEETMILAWEANHRLGIILFAVFLTIGVISIISYPIYKNQIYQKNKQKEIYDLSFTKEELNEIKAIKQDEFIDKTFENNNEKPYIKTTHPKGFLILFIVITFLGIIIVLLGLILADDPTDKIPIMIMGLFFSFLGGLGLFAIKNEYEILDGDILYVKRFFKMKEIPIKEIASITVNRQMVIFYDINTKVITRASTMTKGLAKIVEYLADNGVILERIMQ